MKPTLVIGDVHGHIDRLAALLEQEGVIEEIGDGGDWARINYDVEVVQLGDLGHFGGSGGSPTGDKLCYAYANDWLDVVLWGNHDRAVVSEAHAFRGYERPSRDTTDLMRSLVVTGKYRLAHAAHGHFMTHAGLHNAFKYNKLDEYLKTDPGALANWLNANDMRSLNELEVSPGFIGIRDAVSRYRGGSSRYGGILWRDITEDLYMEFPQVFGHSADHKSHAVRYCWEKGNTRKLANVPDFVKQPSYCIDIGGRNNVAPEHCLMGLWLPEGKIVRVDL